MEGETRYDWGGSKNHIFEHNLYYGNHVNGPEDAHAVVADPLFVAPLTAGVGFETLEGFMLKRGSPAIRAGLRISGNGGRDLFGNPLPEALPPCIGVHEFPVTW